MVFSLFDVLYVTMGILFVYKYFGFKNIKIPNTNNTSLVKDDITPTGKKNETKHIKNKLLNFI
jgi:hypothetical protein